MQTITERSKKGKTASGFKVARISHHDLGASPSYEGRRVSG